MVSDFITMYDNWNFRLDSWNAFRFLCHRTGNYTCVHTFAIYIYIYIYNGRGSLARILNGETTCRGSTSSKLKSKGDAEREQLPVTCYLLFLFADGDRCVLRHPAAGFVPISLVPVFPPTDNRLLASTGHLYACRYRPIDYLFRRYPAEGNDSNRTWKPIHLWLHLWFLLFDWRSRNVWENGKKEEDNY